MAISQERATIDAKTRIREAHKEIDKSRSLSPRPGAMEALTPRMGGLYKEGHASVLDHSFIDPSPMSSVVHRRTSSRPARNASEATLSRSFSDRAPTEDGSISQGNSPPHPRSRKTLRPKATPNTLASCKAPTLPLTPSPGSAHLTSFGGGSSRFKVGTPAAATPTTPSPFRRISSASSNGRPASSSGYYQPTYLSCYTKHAATDGLMLARDHIERAGVPLTSISHEDVSYHTPTPSATSVYRHAFGVSRDVRQYAPPTPPSNKGYRGRLPLPNTLPDKPHESVHSRPKPKAPPPPKSVHSEIQPLLHAPQSKLIPISKAQRAIVPSNAARPHSLPGKYAKSGKGAGILTRGSSPPKVLRPEIRVVKAGTLTRPSRPPQRPKPRSPSNPAAEPRGGSPFNRAPPGVRSKFEIWEDGLAERVAMFGNNEGSSSSSESSGGRDVVEHECEPPPKYRPYNRRLVEEWLRPACLKITPPRLLEGGHQYRHIPGGNASAPHDRRLTLPVAVSVHGGAAREDCKLLQPRLGRSLSAGVGSRSGRSRSARRAQHVKSLVSRISGKCFGAEAEALRGVGGCLGGGRRGFRRVDPRYGTLDGGCAWGHIEYQRVGGSGPTERQGRRRALSPIESQAEERDVSLEESARRVRSLSKGYGIDVQSVVLREEHDLVLPKPRVRRREGRTNAVQLLKGEDEGRSQRGVQRGADEGGPKGRSRRGVPERAECRTEAEVVVKRDDSAKDSDKKLLDKKTAAALAREEFKAYAACQKELLALAGRAAMMPFICPDSEGLGVEVEVKDLDLCDITEDWEPMDRESVGMGMSEAPESERSMRLSAAAKRVRVCALASFGEELRKKQDVLRRKEAEIAEFAGRGDRLGVPPETEASGVLLASKGGHSKEADRNDAPGEESIMASLTSTAAPPAPAAPSMDWELTYAAVVLSKEAPPPSMSSRASTAQKEPRAMVSAWMDESTSVRYPSPIAPPPAPRQRRCRSTGTDGTPRSNRSKRKNAPRVQPVTPGVPASPQPRPRTIRGPAPTPSSPAPSSPAWVSRPSQGLSAKALLPSMLGSSHVGRGEVLAHRRRPDIDELLSVQTSRASNAVVK